jgi:hypothetical protein
MCGILRWRKRGSMSVYEVELSLPMSIKIVIEAEGKRSAAARAMSLAAGDPRRAVKDAAMVFSGTPSLEAVDELH